MANKISAIMENVVIGGTNGVMVGIEANSYDEAKRIAEAMISARVEEVRRQNCISAMNSRMALEQMLAQALMDTEDESDDYEDDEEDYYDDDVDDDYEDYEVYDDDDDDYDRNSGRSQNSEAYNRLMEILCRYA